MQESTAKFIELGQHKVTHIETGHTQSLQEGLLNVSGIKSIVPEGLTDCIIITEDKEYLLINTGYRDTVDKIKKSFSLEDFEKTVFELTKALTIREAPGNVAERVFGRAIDLAQEWYEGSEARSKAFQKIASDFDEENEPEETKKQPYGFAGKRTY